MRLFRGDGVRARKCGNCGSTATWHSQVNSNWYCDNCHPCWCGWCNGRIGAHGPEAVELYRQQARAAGTPR